MSERRLAASEADVVVITRVQLSRNYEDLPFGPKLRADQAQEVVRRAESALAKGVDEKFTLFHLWALSADEVLNMVDRYQISMELMRKPERAAVLLTADRARGVMLNEADHLHIQSLLPGLALERAAADVFSLDEAMDAEHPYAFDDQFGYLTCSPSIAGTGMQACVLLHVPALLSEGKIGELVQEMSKRGIAARGRYGKGADTRGDTFQLSNDACIGGAEERMIENLIAGTERMIEAEREAREAMRKRDPLELEDRLLRSVGILKCARIMSGAEWLRRYSDLRLAAAMGVVHAALDDIDALRPEMEPAGLALAAGRVLKDRARDAFRAERLRAEIHRILA